MEEKAIARQIPRKFSDVQKIAITGLLAGVYAAVTIALGSISYGPINLRFANLLIAVVPFVGWPGVFGISLGVFLGNISSPLGPIDLVSALFSLLGLAIVKVLSRRTVLGGLASYSVILSLWVSFELMVAYGTPFFPIFYFVLAGITVVVVGFTYPLYRSLRSSGLLRRFSDAA